VGRVELEEEEKGGDREEGGGGTEYGANGGGGESGERIDVREMVRGKSGGGGG